MNVTIETRYTVIVDGERHSQWYSRQAADDTVLHQMEEMGAESAYVVETYDEVPVADLSMPVDAMAERWDEINSELDAIHDELAGADGRPSEEAMAAAQAPLLAERRQLEAEYAAMRCADAEAEKVREMGMAIFA